MENKSDQSSTAGGIRSITAHWVITGEMVLKTAALFIGSEEEKADMSVLRDAKDGVPLIPGSSLAGALRNHLADVLGGYFSPEDPRVSNLFGTARNDNTGSQSPLIVFDSLGPSEQSYEIRDGVAIDPETGIAEDHKKYDMEVLPPGTTFPLRLDLIVKDTESEKHLMTLLIKTLEGLQEGEISLGARRSRGLGCISTGNWHAIRYDLTTQDGWLEWLSSDPIQKPIQNGKDKVYEACKEYFKENLEDIADKRRRLIITSDLVFANGLLVRSPSAIPDAPDVAHIQSGGKPILSGTSLAGALRKHSTKIAWNVHKDKKEAERWVWRMFGPRAKDSQYDESMAASRLRVSETIVEGTLLRPSRNCTDRFTQGVCSGSLFDEESVFGGTTKIRLELRNPNSGECGLLLLLLKDLIDKDVTIGGCGSIGRGVAKGNAVIQYEDKSIIEIKQDSELKEDDLKKIDAEITIFSTEKVNNNMEREKDAA